MQSERLICEDGKSIRKVTLRSFKRITELYFQEVNGVWVQFKRLVYTLH